MNIHHSVNYNNQSLSASLMGLYNDSGMFVNFKFLEILQMMENMNTVNNNILSFPMNNNIFPISPMNYIPSPVLSGKLDGEFSTNYSMSDLINKLKNKIMPLSELEKQNQTRELNEVLLYGINNMFNGFQTPNLMSSFDNLKDSLLLKNLRESLDQYNQNISGNGFNTVGASNNLIIDNEALKNKSTDIEALAQQKTATNSIKKVHKRASQAQKKKTNETNQKRKKQKQSKIGSSYVE